MHIHKYKHKHIHTHINTVTSIHRGKRTHIVRYIHRRAYRDIDTSIYRNGHTQTQSDTSHIDTYRNIQTRTHIDTQWYAHTDIRSNNQHTRPRTQTLTHRLRFSGIHRRTNIDRLIERHTYRQTHKKKHIDRHISTDPSTYTDAHIDILIYLQVHTDTYTDRNRHTRYVRSMTHNTHPLHKQTHTHTNKRTYKHRYTHIHTYKYTYI